jgi:hypothetical protein
MFGTFNRIDLYFAVIFKTSQLKINYIDIKEDESQHYTIGGILSLLELMVSKSVRRNIKGVKILLIFLIKKIMKEYRNKNCILHIKGLSKLYLKIFYYLGNLFIHLNIKSIVWVPLRS